MEILPIRVKDDKPQFRNINKLAPQFPYRCLVIGKSGSGKSNLVLNMLYKYLDFDTLTVYAKHIDNPEYSKLQEDLEKHFEEANENKKDTEDIERPFFFTNTLEKFIPIECYSTENQNLLLFDDLAGLPERQQQPIVDVYIRGRHRNISSIYISQSYKRIPKTVRLQANYVIVFKGLNEMDLKSLYGDFVSKGLPYEDFKSLYHHCTNKKYDFMVLDCENMDLHLRYKFDSVWIDPNDK